MGRKRVNTPAVLLEWLDRYGRDLAVSWSHEDRSEDTMRWLVVTEYVHLPSGRGVVVRLLANLDGEVLSSTLFVEAGAGRTWTATLADVDAFLGVSP